MMSSSPLVLQRASADYEQATRHSLSASIVPVATPEQQRRTVTPASPIGTSSSYVTHHLRDAAILHFARPADEADQSQLAGHMSAARTAYAKAFMTIRRSAKGAAARSTLDCSTGLCGSQELTDAALQLCAAQAAEDRSRAERFVDVLHHYQGVFDVLSQADWSYLTLLWGGMKLILVMAKNRSDLLTSIMEMLVEIGLNLSRVEVYTKLYPTVRMIEITSQLYAAVMEFISEIVAHFHRHFLRQLFSSLIRPFQEKFGKVIDRINRLENHVQKDAQLMQALQTSSIAHHAVDAYLHRRQAQTMLHSISIPQQPQPELLPIPEILRRVKETLFQCFPEQATYHDELATTYRTTASAWSSWFSHTEHKVPSSASTAPRTHLVQGLCDAPDSQHAFQWAARRRVETPEVPAMCLVWAPGMTARSAIAALIFQVVQQKPEILARDPGMAVGDGSLLSLDVFSRASSGGIKGLWDLFIHVIKAAGGCQGFFCLTSAGWDEKAFVEQLVRTSRKWDGPLFATTVIHPADAGFTRIGDGREVVLDEGTYDIHPVTDALYHVLVLELDASNPPVSENIKKVLWESLWREVRYSVIDITWSLLESTAHQVVEETLEAVSRDIGKELSDRETAAWQIGVGWHIKTKSMRDRIRKHMDMVDMSMPVDIRTRLSMALENCVLGVDMENLSTGELTEAQRDRLWGAVRRTIISSATVVFCGALPELVRTALEIVYAKTSAAIHKNPTSYAKIREVALAMALWSKRQEFDPEESIERGFLKDNQLMLHGIETAITIGFRDIVIMLANPDPSEVDGCHFFISGDIRKSVRFIREI